MTKLRNPFDIKIAPKLPEGDVEIEDERVQRDGYVLIWRRVVRWAEITFDGKKP